MPSDLVSLPPFLLSQPLSMIGQDVLPMPPALRHRASPSGDYHLVLTLTEAEGRRYTIASLYVATDAVCQQIWSQPLPHSYGPRLALVNDAGTVVLLDDWINVASPRAIVVLDRAGAVMAQHSFDDIVATTGQSRAAVVDQAAQGFWLAGNPEIHRAGSHLSIPTAGGQLTLDLTNGKIEF
ncbi:MAG: hypothetical protein ACFCVB_11230 [Nodosilinea sp.]